MTIEVLGLWSKSQEAHGFGGILAVGDGYHGGLGFVEQEPRGSRVWRGLAVGGGCGGGYMPLAVYVVVMVVGFV
uniref:Uncharacterized protein n=1 Tax=Fagus sylvatica TaxID=28930 RepID=A0A2N9ILR0_FAGSY